MKTIKFQKDTHLSIKTQQDYLETNTVKIQIIIFNETCIVELFDNTKMIYNSYIVDIKDLTIDMSLTCCNTYNDIFFKTFIKLDGKVIHSIIRFEDINLNDNKHIEIYMKQIGINYKTFEYLKEQFLLQKERTKKYNDNILSIYHSKHDLDMVNFNILPDDNSNSYRIFIEKDIKEKKEMIKEYRKNYLSIEFEDIWQNILEFNYYNYNLIINYNQYDNTFSTDNEIGELFNLKSFNIFSKILNNIINCKIFVGNLKRYKYIIKENMILDFYVDIKMGNVNSNYLNIFKNYKIKTLGLTRYFNDYMTINGYTNKLNILIPKFKIYISMLQHCVDIINKLSIKNVVLKFKYDHHFPVNTLNIVFKKLKDIRFILKNEYDFILILEKIKQNYKLERINHKDLVYDLYELIYFDLNIQKQKVENNDLQWVYNLSTTIDMNNLLIKYKKYKLNTQKWKEFKKIKVI
jgi:hypothetical protein